MDGSSWSVVFATDASVVNTTSIALADISAAKIRVSMYESGPANGQALGLYANASLSEYAYDKYFLNYVSELGTPSLGNPDVPALVAVEASLSSATSELQQVLATCAATRPTALALQQVRSSMESMQSSGAGVDVVAELLSAARARIIAALKAALEQGREEVVVIFAPGWQG
eukprot:3726789-Amphidinium_carterae.1